MRFTVKTAVISVVDVALLALLYLWLNAVSWKPDSYIHKNLSMLNDAVGTVALATLAIVFFVCAVLEFRNIAEKTASIGVSLTKLGEKPENEIELPNDFLELQTIFQRVRIDILTGQKSEQEAIQRKNDLIMYLAHDLKTPLTSILGYLALLRDEQDISPQNRQKYITVVSEKAVRLENLINDFFEIARFNLNEIVLEKSLFDFSRLAEQVTDEFKPLLIPKGLRFETDTVDRAELFADPGKLERVMDNLLRNAIGYSFDNSTIRVSIIKDENSLKLQVSNRGPQIPAHKIERIFEQFYRVDTARSGETGGAGLGLTIARAIVEQHGGRIAAESDPERTTFSIMLPLAKIS
jgi:two-component system sensor histidine kinase VanS